MTIGDEVRSEVAKILARFNGLDIAAVKVSTVQKLSTVLDEEDQRAKACTCGANHPEFDLVAHQELPSRSNPMAAAFAVNAAHGRGVL